MAKGFLPLKRASYPGSQTSSPERNNNTSPEPSNMSGIRSGLSLPLRQMAIPIYTTPSQRDVEAGGRILFRNFIHEELAHEGLPDDVIEGDIPPPDAFGDAGPEVYSQPNVEEQTISSAMASTPEGFNTENLAKFGVAIREIADEFAVSHQRQQIKEHADQVDLGQITYASFSTMLSEVFRNGIDKYCIVALFYFCRDILIRCVKSQLNVLGSKLFFWALDFLVRNVCKWVYDHGGWERVLSKFYNVAMKVSAAVALGVIIICGIIFIRKNL